MENEIQSVVEILKKDQNNPEAILEYSIYTFEVKKDLPKAFQMLLNLLGTVNDKNPLFKNVKLYMSKVIKKADPLDILLNLPFWNELTDNQNAAIYAWLGLIVKEHGGIWQSVVFLKKAMQIFPKNQSYVLNLVHVLEIELKYKEALELSLNIIKELIPELVFDLETGRIINENSNTVIGDKDHELLALIFNIIKVLYLQGKMKFIKEWIERVFGLISRSFSNLENVEFKGEYFKCLKELVKYMPVDKINEKFMKPVYIIGDGSCITSAYQIINLNSEERVLTPYLIHGLKIYHLRDECDYFTKNHYFNIVNKLRNENIDYLMIMLGTCDMKEIFEPIEKGPKNEEEMTKLLIDLFLVRMKELSIFLRCCKILICPILPILDDSNERVIRFNTAFSSKMNEEGKNLTNLIYLGGFENELITNKLKFYLDGHHSNPNWLQKVPIFNK